MNEIAEVLPGQTAQQRAKLRPEAIKEVLDGFNTSLIDLLQPPRCAAPGYRCLAVDGSTASFYSTPRFSPDRYFVSGGHSMKGFYSVHVDGLFDIDTHLYMDAILQPVHDKDEFRAFCPMVDRIPLIPGTSDIYIGDRGSSIIGISQWKGLSIRLSQSPIENEIAKLDSMAVNF